MHRSPRHRSSDPIRETKAATSPVEIGCTAKQPGFLFAETCSRGGAKRARTATDTEPEPDQSDSAATPTWSSWGVKRARAGRHPRRPVPKCCWAALTYGPAGLVAERALANDVADYLSFRAVCREWRRCTEATVLRAQGCLDRRFHPHRWIMLREAVPPGPGTFRRRFLNVSTGQCVQTELPELGGHHLLGPTAEGLLVLLDEATYVVRLLNPLTRQVAELPSLDQLLSTETRKNISMYGIPSYAFEVTGTGLAGNSTVALCFLEPTMLIVAKPGDDRWTLVEGERWFYSATSFAGRFYCATGSAVMALELATANQPPRLAVVAKITARVSLMMLDTVHLVEGDGELLMLHRQLRCLRESDGCERRYKAYQVDLDARKTVPVRGLGGRAVFLGETRALSVPRGVFPTIRANTVYLGFGFRERTNWEKLGAYCLLNGRTERSSFSWDDGWARPCSVADYLSWYVTDRCGDIEEI